jgi:hypothetical protein
MRLQFRYMINILPTGYYFINSPKPNRKRNK